MLEDEELIEEKKQQIIQHSLKVLKIMGIDSSCCKIINTEGTGQLIVKCNDKRVELVLKNIIKTIEKRILFLSDEDLDYEEDCGNASFMTH